MRNIYNLVQEEVTHRKDVNKGCSQAHKQNPKHKKGNSYYRRITKNTYICVVFIFFLGPIAFLEDETRPEKRQLKMRSFLTTKFNGELQTGCQKNLN